jgi:hypothetical protein
MLVTKCSNSEYYFIKKGIFAMSCDSNKDQVKKERTNRISSYDRLIELNMILLYTLYSEKDRRLYGAAEALKLGYGGISYISRVLGCDRKTILRGILELNCPELIEKNRIRRKGGGRKTSLESIFALDANFLEVVFLYTAGDPMDEKVRWTHLTHQQIADKLKEKGIDVSRKIVKQLFKKTWLCET